MKKRPKPWSQEEDRIIVRDYLTNQREQEKGNKVNKAATRRALLMKLNRSAASVEFKRCNISAVLVDLGLPWWKGYRPASNYQKSLKAVVEKEWVKRAT